MTKHQAPRSTQAPAQPPRLSIWLAAVVLGIVGLQMFGGGSTSRREKPGPTRGDALLSENALPAELAGWTRTRFIPAAPVDELPEGQYWWVHQWHYQKDGTTAIVSFDQLGEAQWHELTWCYRNLDWQIEDRTLCADSEKSAPYVVARLRKSDSEYALLVFSVFFEDGSWAAPPDVNLSLMNNANLQDPSLLDKMQMKFDPLVVFADQNSGHTRALQCQCFMAGSRRFTQLSIDAAIELHLESRQKLCQHWLEHARTLKSNTPTEVTAAP